MLLADKCSNQLDQLSLFLRKLRREMTASASLQKCNNEDSAQIVKLIFSFVYCSISEQTGKVGEVMNSERILEFLLVPLFSNYLYYSNAKQ